jgi:hypothetical protein
MYLLLNWPSLLKAACFLLANTARKRKLKLNILRIKFILFFNFKNFSVAKFFFFIFSYLACNQIWLNMSMDDGYIGYITKLTPKEKKKPISGTQLGSFKGSRASNFLFSFFFLFFGSTTTKVTLQALGNPKLSSLAESKEGISPAHHWI